MPMLQSHYAFWPNRVPHTVTLPETTLSYNLDNSAARYPSKPAIAYYGREITYRELQREVERLAGYLQQRLGVKAGDRVLLHMQNCPQFIIGYYAILRANAVVVPMNSMMVTNELRYYVKDSGATVALSAQDLYPQLVPMLREKQLKHIVVAAYSDYRGELEGITIPEVVRAPRQDIRERGVVLWKDALAAKLAPGSLTAGPDDLAVLPYTSGTTGEPKGCMHTHRTVHGTAASGVVWAGANPDGVSLVTLPLFHVTAMQGGMNAPIFIGSRIVLMTRWDRDATAAFIQRYQCTGWGSISTMMIDFLANPRLADYDLSSLNSLGGGGAPLPAAVGERLQQLTGLSYVEGYGLTETMAATNANPPDRAKLQCLGIPFVGVDARVINPETLEELGPNQEGEIVLHGPQVMVGYWRKPEETAKAFITLDGKRFFRSGDLGRYDEEGYFWHVDRLKRMINASGFKVWPAEVETKLYNHPAVLEACVIASPDPRRGETVKALIVPREGYRGKVTPEEIIEWSKGEMAAYKYPRIVEFVETLPKSGSGKVLWRVLQEQEKQKAAVAPAAAT